MKVTISVCAAIVAAMLPAVALADDPNDPAMRSAAARARDREIIRQLNLRELAMVRERDARYAEGWRAYGRATPADGEFAARSQDYERAGSDYERASADYARDRERYERDMAEWRRAVRACREGDYSACAD